jgi:quinol monooxygenase YgiN
MARQDLWVTATYTVKDGMAEAMKPHLHQLIGAVRQEHGCLFDDCVQNGKNPNAFMFIEHWATRADFDAHVAGAPAKKWSDATGHMLAVPVEIFEHRSIWPE